MKIKVKDVVFQYDSVKVLENITFEACSGELTCILGPNGSGKTTLIKCIDDILKPKAGVILINGKDISQLKREELAKIIGVVPQSENTTYLYTVLDIVLMGREPYLSRFSDISRADLQIVEEVMKLTNISYLAERTVNELSGGEFQRVLIARALAQDPKVLLLDEPTSHLDINHQLELMELIRKITKEKRLVTLMTTHDLNIAVRFGDKFLLLNSGRIYASGSFKDVFRPEILEDVFRVKTRIQYDPSLKHYFIIPLNPVR